jgi:NAD(P)-dependent dehydrogenase (short-subunit alcohol dehydrogenase family)
MSRFANKKVLVTGSAAGIGKEIAVSFAREGATLALADINQIGLEQVVQELHQFGENARGYQIDVTREDQVKPVITQILQDLGGLDVLINNAGVSTMQWSWDITEDEWDHNMNVNAKGCWLVTKHVAPHMIQRRAGRIVNIASMGGLIGAPLLAHYCASKFAVVGLTQSISKELAPYGITVNAVCPGFVHTAMQDREVIWEAKLRGFEDPEEVRKEYVKLTPMGRLSVPKDIAPVVLFLASDDAGFITGDSIRVSGGQ